MISDISNIIVGVSAVVVAVVAVFGLNSWRKEIVGKSKYDLAKRLMLLVNRLEDEFGWARFSLSESGEYLERPRPPDEPAAITPIRNEWFLRKHRIQPLKKDMLELHEANWEAQTILDEDTSKVVGDGVKRLSASLADLDTSVDYYFEAKEEEARGISTNVDSEWLAGLRKTIYGRANDDFSRQINEVVIKFGSALKKYLH